MLYPAYVPREKIPLPQKALIYAGNSLVDAIQDYVKVAKKTNITYTMVEYSSDPAELAKRLRPFTYAVLPNGASMSVMTYTVPPRGTPVLEKSTVVNYEEGKKNAIVCGPVYNLYDSEMNTFFTVNLETKVATPTRGEFFAAIYTGDPTFFDANRSHADHNLEVKSMHIQKGDYLVKISRWVYPSYRVAKDAFDKLYEIVPDNDYYID